MADVVDFKESQNYKDQVVMRNIRRTQRMLVRKQIFDWASWLTSVAQTEKDDMRFFEKFEKVLQGLKDQKKLFEDT